MKSFNRSGFCISYQNMKKRCADLARYAILQSEGEDRKVPLPSYFSKSLFTLSAFDNFDHADRNTLSGKASAHDTAITLFQEKPTTPISKSLKSQVNLRGSREVRKLPCQYIIPYKSPRSLIIPDSFKVDKELFHSPNKIK